MERWLFNPRQMANVDFNINEESFYATFKNGDVEILNQFQTGPSPSSLTIFR
jgi:hypothetical protein